MKFSLLCGSSKESAEQKGAAHLLSINMFAGNNNKTGLRLMRELEDIGAVISSSFDRQKITVDVTVINNYTEVAFENISNIININNATQNNDVNMSTILTDSFSTAELTYDNYKKNPKLLLTELLHEAAFGENSNMGSSILANNYDLHNLNVNNALEFKKNNFVANNLIISSSGIKHDQLKKLTEKYLSNLATNTNNTTINYNYVGGDAKLRNDFDKTYLALAFPVTNNNCKAFNVLRVLLSNKLNKSLDIANNNGEITGFYAPYTTIGLWGFYANGTSSAVANKLIESAIKELRNVSTNNINNDDLEAAKKQLTLQKTTELESEKVTCSLLNSLLFNTKPNDYVNFNNITSNDVVNAAKSSLAANVTPSWAVLGKTAGAHNFSTIFKLLNGTA